MSHSKRYYWIKLQEEFFKSIPIKKLRSMPNGDNCTIIYQRMLLLSLKNNGVLIFEGYENTFEEEMALVLEEKLECVKQTIQFLKDKHLLEEVEENAYELPYVNEVVGSETDSAIRKREQRKKQGEREKTPCDNVLTMSRQCHIEKEKEIEKEVETEKETETEKKKKKEVRERKKSEEGLQGGREREENKTQQHWDELLRRKQQEYLSPTMNG